MTEPLLIRADANQRIGAGHTMRCLALAQAWQDRGGRAVFVTQAGFEALEQRLRENDAPVHHAQGPAGSAQDAQHFSQVAGDLGARWVVVDGYAFRDDYQLALKRRGHKIVWIDDYAHVPIRHVDIVVNQNIYADPAMYPDPPSDTVFLLGSFYAMIRREFLEGGVCTPQPPARAFRLLVTLGGGTHYQAVTKIVRAAAKLREIPLEIRIVVGLSQSHDEDFQNAIESCPHRVQLIYNPPSMPDLMRWADAAVSAAGSTCWELAYLGVPSLIIIVAENQRRIAESLHAYGSAINLGWSNECSQEQLVAALEQICSDESRRSGMSALGTRLIDGRGAFRIVDRIKQG